MSRRYLTRRARTRIFDAANGECCICKLYIHAERGDKWIVEHVKPLWLGGADDDSNMRPAHYRCAIEKTTAEAPVKAKNDRIRARHLGIRKSRKTIAGRRFDGTPIPSRMVERS
jgi:5-methylcytosine-specific restriction endonuclease McrA